MNVEVLLIHEPYMDSAEKMSVRMSSAMNTLLAGAPGSARLVYLDPPFGTGKSFFHVLQSGKDGQEVLAFQDPLIEGSAVTEIARDLAQASQRALRSDGVVAIHGDTNISHLYRMAFDEVFGSDNFLGELIVRAGSRDDQPRLHSARSLTPTHNAVLLFGSLLPTPGSELPRYDRQSCASIARANRRSTFGRTVETIWCDVDTRGRDTGYPTEKSKPFCSRLLQWFTDPGDLVIEPFGGSASMSFTALESGRRAIVGDNSPAALSVMLGRVGRWATGTGHVAELRTGSLPNAPMSRTPEVGSLCVLACDSVGRLLDLWMPSSLEAPFRLPDGTECLVCVDEEGIVVRPRQQ
jgi:hypothetical protein